MYGLFSKYRSLWDMFYYFLLLFFLKLLWNMAESVDALVSNTSGFTSIPVRPRVWVPRKAKN